MKKNNLLQSHFKTYEIKSSEKEVFETQSCFHLKVKDSANAVEEIAKRLGECCASDVIKKLYATMKNYHLQKAVFREFDSSKYNVSVKISDYQNTRIAEVRITKRSVFEKIQSRAEDIFEKFIW